MSNKKGNKEIIKTSAIIKRYKNCNNKPKATNRNNKTKVKKQMFKITKWTRSGKCTKIKFDKVKK